MQASYTGAVESMYNSLPFGDGYAASGEDIDAYHFAGQDQDTSANDHAQYREYSNLAGRWFSPDPYTGSYDPLNPQSMNRYAYVLSNPLGFTDPWGLQPCDDTDYYFDWGVISNSCVTANSGGASLGSMGLDPSAGSGGGYGQIGGGRTGGGSGVGSFTGTGAPNNGPSKSVFLCGAEAASKVSLAGGLSHIPGLGSGFGGFVANAIGGNAFSGATDLVHSIATGEGGGHSVFYNMGQGVIAGPTQGFGAAFGSAIEGTPWAADLVGVGTKALVGAEYASGVGEVKLGYDFLTWAGGVAGCAAGIIH